MKEQSDTSKLSYEKIMQPGARESHYRKILTALNKIKDGTSWEIADATEQPPELNIKKLKPDQVWKRISELIDDDVIFDTGIRRNSPDGNPAMVYALSSRRGEYAHIKPPERIEKTTAADFASLLINSTAHGKRIIQNDLFEPKNEET